MAESPKQSASPILSAIAGFLSVAEVCEHCRLKIGGHDAADGPAVFIIVFVGSIVAGLALWLELAFAPPTWVHMVIWPPVITVLAVGALRPFKGAFIGAQYKYRATGREIPPKDNSQGQ